MLEMQSTVTKHDTILYVDKANVNMTWSNKKM